MPRPWFRPVASTVGPDRRAGPDCPLRARYQWRADAWSEFEQKATKETEGFSGRASSSHCLQKEAKDAKETAARPLGHPPFVSFVSFC